MLTITKKEYEIEEDIQLLDDNNKELMTFKMKINSNELKDLEKALLGKDTLKLAKQIQNFEKKDLTEDETDKVLLMAEEMNNKADKMIEDYCFKEYKDRFLELGGEAKFEEMKEVISDYLLTFFITKRSKRANTINSDLAKITQK